MIDQIELKDYQIILSIIALSIGIIGSVYKLLERLLNRIQYKKSIPYLKDYFTESDIHFATKYFINPKWQTSSPDNNLEPKKNNNKGAILKYLISQIDTETSNKYNFILAGAGMGKTSILINLIKKYNSKVFKINRKTVIYHQFGSNNILEKIKNDLQNKKIIPENTVLLLDSFDEDKKAIKNNIKRLQEVEKFVSEYKFCKTIITCRTHFFLSKDNEPKRTNEYDSFIDEFHHYNVIYLSPFDKKEVKKYIRKRFAFFQFRKKIIARQIIKCSAGLMSRPLLLSHINTLISHKKESKKSLNINYVADVYDIIIDKWIKREGRILFYKGKISSQENIFNKFCSELYDFSLNLANKIYNESDYADCFSLPYEEIVQFLNENKFYSLKKLNLENRSLLNRLDNGCYKFAHKCLLDYFLALYNFQKIPDSQTNKLRDIESKGFDECSKYYEELLVRRTINDYKTKGTFSYNTKNHYLSNLLKFEKDYIDRLSLDEYTNIDFRFFSLFPNLKNLALGQEVVLSDYDLTEFINNKELWIRNRDVQNIEFISSVSELKQLDIANYHKDQIYQLYHNLKENNEQITFDEVRENVNESRNNIISIESLSNLTQLEVLGFANNKVVDISHLSNIKKIHHLDFVNNNVSNIDVVTNLLNLKILAISDNIEIKSLKPIAALDNLETLWLNYIHLKLSSSMDILLNSTIKTLNISGEEFSLSRIVKLSKMNYLQNLDLQIEESENKPEYKYKIAECFPNIVLTINSELVTVENIQEN